MYTPDQRAQLRSGLLDCAARDPRLSGAAITGSGAAGREDEWSDIDLAFGVAAGADVPSVLSEWTARMYDHHGALHHHDVRAGAWIYRVFLLPGALQVDLAFAPEAEFRGLGPNFKLISGTSKQPGSFPKPSPDDLVGLGWLYALHARGSLARGKLWQAEFMISGLRNQALALACLRYDLSAVHGRGLDSLPSGLAREFEAALVRQLEPAELAHALAATVRLFIAEVRLCDPALASRIEPSLGELWKPSAPQ